MEKVIEIEGKKIGVKATAGTVCLYRGFFGRDLLNDMSLFEKELLKTKTLQTETAEIAEKAIWTMAREYYEAHKDDKDAPENVPQLKEWLDQFSPFFIYNACVHVLNMWIENTKSLNSTKKN